MKVLIADDDPVSRTLLETILRRWNYDVVIADNGSAAWQTLQQADAPKLAILDWEMPGATGLSLCRRVRDQENPQPPYLILLTARGTKEDLINGLAGGADDFLAKPLDPSELRARLQVARRMLGLQAALADRVHQLEEALKQIKQLHDLLPMCAWCRKVRDDHNYWHQLESYLVQYVDARFTHGICPECMKQMLKTNVASASEAT
jgi:phosphoserine phosphatase RsbU/P